MSASVSVEGDDVGTGDDDASFSFSNMTSCMTSRRVSRTDSIDSLTADDGLSRYSTDTQMINA